MHIFYLLIALICSTAGAVSGIGGGVVIKPVLDSISPYSVDTIHFLSGCTVLSMAAVSLLRCDKSLLRTNLKHTCFIAVGAAAGGILGKWAFDQLLGLLRGPWLSIVQSLLLLLMILVTFVFMAIPNRFPTLRLRNALSLVAAGLVLGGISAFLGIGGGPLNILVLSVLFSSSEKVTAIHSLFVILLSQASSLTVSLAQGSFPEFDPVVLGLMIAGGICGGLIGSALHKRLRNRHVRWILIGMFGVVILIQIVNIGRWVSLLCR